MLMVVRMNYEKETCEVLFENEDLFECEIFVDELEDTKGIEICEEY